MTFPFRSFSALLVTAFVAMTILLTPIVRAAPLDGYELPDGAVEARFVEVIDGDTFVAEVEENGQWREETIRMIGIDTPENSYSYGNQPECYGNEATRFADSILNAAPRIWLEEDRRDTDDFGRLLRYVWYEDPASGSIFMLNEELVYNGYALANDYRPNTTRQDVLDDAEDLAISESYGMWMECDRTVTGDPEQEDDSGPSTEEPTPGGEGVVEDDVFCAVFDNYQDAQDFLAEFPEIAEYIDIDGDGIACEDWFP